VTGPALSDPCRACGACCAYAADWPRFTLEDDAALARIPPALVDPSGAGMRCTGNRCAALIGEIGRATSCAIYDLRPDVCRACQPGDDACTIARSHFGLAALDLPVLGPHL
jgi:uncharacterized protein